MQRALSLALATLFGTTFTATALAQAPQGTGQPPAINPAEAFIKSHDADGDGKVSQAEALAPQEARFKETDTDGDGFITADEFRQRFMARVPPQAQEQLKQRNIGDPGESFVKELDKNGDGKVDLGESQQPAIGGFKQMDANGDGLASLDEADAFFRQMWEQARQQYQQQGQPPAQ